MYNFKSSLQSLSKQIGERDREAKVAAEAEECL